MLMTNRVYYEGRLVSLTRQGYPRVTWKEHPLKPGEAWLYVHRLEWYKYHGPIPEGYHVHHKDGNRQNWQIDNLELLTGIAHIRQHAAEKFGPRPADLTCEKCDVAFYRRPGERYGKRNFCSVNCKNLAGGPPKIQWPEPSKLLALVEASTCRAVAEQLGVSDTAIKKRLKKAGLW